MTATEASSLDESSLDAPSNRLRLDDIHVDGPRAGLALTYLAAATTPWTAVRVGGVAVGDAFLILAAIALAISDLRKPFPRLPPWVWVLVLAILATGVSNQFFPSTQNFVIHRDQLLGNFQILHSPIPASTNIVVMVPLVMRVVLLTFVFGLARSHDARATVRVAKSIVIGVAISAAVGFLDSRGVGPIGPRITGAPLEGTRAPGLSQHPNILGLTCVVALPLTVWLLRSSNRRTRTWAIGALVITLLGLFAAQSRSGAAAAAIAALVSVGWLPQYRRSLASIGLFVGLVASAVFVAKPSVGADLLDALRLTGGDTGGSDRARSVVNDQALRDFAHSPVRGIGFGVAEQAHVVYLQAMAVGGIVLLVGLVIYQVGGLVRTARLARVEPIAIPLFAAVLGGLVFNAAQNALTPTVVYLAAGLAASLPVPAKPSEPERPARSAAQLGS